MSTTTARDEQFGAVFNAGETVEVDVEEALKSSKSTDGGESKPKKVQFHMSSNAGAGSALFHTYRSERRREEDRVEAMKRAKSEKLANEKFIERRKRAEDRLSEQTNKKRNKRRKRKEKQRLAREEQKRRRKAEETVKD